MMDTLLKLTRHAALVFLLLQSAGCAVIHFDNGDVIPDPEASEPFSWTFGLFEDDDLREYDAGKSIRFRKWYHHAILQIAEVSNPLETSQVCSGLDWNQITTEVTPFDAFVGLLDNALLLHTNSAGLDLWSPWSIEYSCRDVQ